MVRMNRAVDSLEPFRRAIAKARLASAGISVDAPEHRPSAAAARSSGREAVPRQTEERSEAYACQFYPPRHDRRQ